MTKSKTFRFSEELTQRLEDLAKTGEYSSETAIASKALEQFFDALRKTGTETTQKPPTDQELQKQLTEALQELNDLKEAFARDTECFSRFQHEGLYLCAKNAPKIVALSTLKICHACRFKITTATLKQESSEIETRHYYSCGATERAQDGAVLLFTPSARCPDHLKGKWHPLEQCREANCSELHTLHIKKQEKKRI